MTAIQKYNERTSKLKSDACPECGSKYITAPDKEKVCGSCGYVPDERSMSQEPEWRAFDDEQRTRRIRVGPSSTLTIHDKGLSTIIGSDSVRNSKYDPDRRLKVYKLRKWQTRIRVADAYERNLAIGLDGVKNIFSHFNQLQNNKAALEQTSANYRKVASNGMIRGRSLITTAYACIYLTARQTGTALTLDDLATDAEKNGVSRKDIARNYRFIVREFDLKIPVPVNKMYSSKIGNKIQGSPQTEILATRILDVAKGMKLTGGRSPTGIAAAAYYMASVLRNDHRTQKEIAEVANVTEVTIRNRYKELMEKLFIGVPV